MRKFAVLEVDDRVTMSDDYVARYSGPKLTGVVVGYGRAMAGGPFLRVRHDSDGSEALYAPWFWRRDADGMYGKDIQPGDFLPGSSIKPIETVYQGFRFRSRVEARWAIALDVLDVKWEYEKEGYVLPSGPYLPDFWLPPVRMFAEVKAGRFSQDETEMCFELATKSGCAVLMLDGPPAVQSYYAAEPQEDPTIAEMSSWVLTKRRGCIANQGRFYAAERIGDGEHFEDWEHAVQVAKSARFEHGEAGPLVVRVEVPGRRQRVP